MSEFTVAVNDPAYPPGTEISVTGVRVLFKNGETRTVTEADLDPTMEVDVKEALSFVAGFTVSDGVPPVVVEPVEASGEPTAEPANILPVDPTHVEGGEN